MADGSPAAFFQDSAEEWHPAAASHEVNVRTGLADELVDFVDRRGDGGGRGCAAVS